MDFDLAKLIPWTRNASGDRPRSVREDLVGTGGAALTLSNGGGITLDWVSVDGRRLDADAVTVEGNVLTFSSPPEPDSDVAVSYALTRYTDADLRTFLVDAALAVASDLPARLKVSRRSGHIEVPEALLDEEGVEPDAAIQTLIVYKASLDIVADKANQAADDAIMIRDGDTTIDTSKTSQNSEAAVRRLAARYSQALLRAKHGRLRGAFNAGD